MRHCEWRCRPRAPAGGPRTDREGVPLSGRGAGPSRQNVADRVAPVLRGALEGKPPDHAKRRIRELLEATVPDGPCRRRELRAVEVAERIGTAEARELLAAWCGGDKDALLTREARVAAGRLKTR